MNFKDNTNMANTKEELLELLKKYKNVLNKQMSEYLKSLIELEFSVIRNYINESDRNILSNLEIYEKAAIYNIYNRALNIFNNENNDSIDIKECGEQLDIQFKLENEMIKIFNFDYSKRLKKLSLINIQRNHVDKKIVTVSLYSTIESKENIKKELENISWELNRLCNMQNPYINRNPYNTIGGPEAKWKLEHDKRLEYYRKRKEKLRSKLHLSDIDKKEIEITKKYNDLLLEDYGLTNSDFIDDDNDKLKEKSNIEKRLIKKISNIDVINNIKYI